jgi:SAM-dependent methyltransferase
MSDVDRGDAAMPHDAERSALQCQWLTAACRGQDVLDLGCGDGRVASVLAQIAESYVALDNDSEAIRRCHERAPDATMIEGDLRDPQVAGCYDFVLCLGNTLSLLWDVEEAVASLVRWRQLLTERGVVVIDDLADDFWPELAEGRWCAGLDEETNRQLVWAADDAVFAVRDGDAIDIESWHPNERDRRMRLWTAGSLRLVAIAAGFQPPCRQVDGGVLVMRPAPPAPAN